MRRQSFSHLQGKPIESAGLKIGSSMNDKSVGLPEDRVIVQRGQQSGLELSVSLPSVKDDLDIEAYLIELTGPVASGIDDISFDSFRLSFNAGSSIVEGLVKIIVIIPTEKPTKNKKDKGLKSFKADYTIRPLVIEEFISRVSDQPGWRERLKDQEPVLQGNIMSKSANEADRFVEKVISIINENMSDFEFGVCMLHEKLSISRMHLSRKLKLFTGLSPHILIRNIRLEKAAVLLRQNAGNITEIANSIGISNVSWFSKAFREYYGVSPKKFSNHIIN